MDENQPMLMSPIHFSTSTVEVFCAMPRDKKGKGMVAAETSSAMSAMPASGHSGLDDASAGNRRTAISTCNSTVRALMERKGMGSI